MGAQKVISQCSLFFTENRGIRTEHSGANIHIDFTVFNVNINTNIGKYEERENTPLGPQQK